MGFFIYLLLSDLVLLGLDLEDGDNAKTERSKSKAELDILPNEVTEILPFSV